MKKIAEIENNKIVNIFKVKNDFVISDGQIDVTNILCDINNPVVGGTPIPKPSKWHSIDGLDWVITNENKTIKDARELELTRLAEIETEKQGSGLKKITIAQGLGFIDNKIDSSDDIQTQVNGIKSVLKKIIPFIINGG